MKTNSGKTIICDRLFYGTTEEVRKMILRYGNVFFREHPNRKRAKSSEIYEWCNLHKMWD